MPLVLAPFLKGNAPASVALWRYISLGKLVSMLSTGSLYFARLDRFAGDWLDGEVPAAMIDEAGPSTVSELEFDRFRPVQGLGWILGECRVVRTRTAACCWVAAEHEFEGLWSGYAPVEGVAIRTSWRSLELALAECGREIMAGPVTYTADASVGGWIEGGANVSSFVFRKRSEYENDREFRLTIGDPLHSDEGIARDGHVLVPVDLNVLCEEIVVSP